MATHVICRRLASGEGIVSLSVTQCMFVCPPSRDAELVSAVKVMHCILCSLLIVITKDKFKVCRHEQQQQPWNSGRSATWDVTVVDT